MLERCSLFGLFFICCTPNSKYHQQCPLERQNHETQKSNSERVGAYLTTATDRRCRNVQGGRALWNNNRDKTHVAAPPLQARCPMSLCLSLFLFRCCADHRDVMWQLKGSCQLLTNSEPYPNATRTLPPTRTLPEPRRRRVAGCESADVNGGCPELSACFSQTRVARQESWEADKVLQCPAICLDNYSHEK